MSFHISHVNACIHHMHINTSSEMLNAEFIFKGQEIWETSGKPDLVPWRMPKTNWSKKWGGNWPDWQVCLKTWRFIFRTHHSRQINGSLDHSSKRRAIWHEKLIAPTCGNQDLRLRLFSWQHLDMSISQVVQGANLADERLIGTISDGTPSLSLTPSCSQSW